MSPEPPDSNTSAALDTVDGLILDLLEWDPTPAICGSGSAGSPYHFHWGDEEWLIVVAGTPTLRTPEGETALAAGDVVCFPGGRPARTA